MTNAGAGKDIPIGTVLDGTYRIDGLIGRGGMGAVYRASHARLSGKYVAVKVLLTEVREGSESYQRFRREADIATRIGHPNIVQVLDWNTLPDGSPYLVLELLSGESLASRLRRGPIALGQALDIARQAGSALSAAHRAGVIHRDLKPDNIFLVPTDVGGTLGEQVKVLDFGISKMRGSSTIQTQEAAILGTPQYMSPEQASGKNSIVDERTDVFALAAIVYEMISGRAAFAGDNLAQVVFKVVFEDPTPIAQLVPSLPADVANAIGRALAKDPAQRFPDVSSFVSALTGRPMQTLDRPGTSADAMARTGTAAAEAFAQTMASGNNGPGVTPPIAGQVSSPSAPQLAFPPPMAATTTQKTGARKAMVAALLAVVAAGVALVVVTQSGGKSGGAGETVAGGAPTDAVKTGEPAAATKPPTPAPADPVVGAATVDAGAPVLVAQADPPKPPDVKMTRKDPDPDKGGGGDDKGGDSTRPDDAEPESVKGDLDAAKAALDAGDYKKALFLADKTLKVRATPRANMLKLLAYCGRGDLELANAQLKSVRPVDRKRAKKRCAELGVELE